MCLFAPQVMADIYKCVSEDGTVKFSDEPCSNNAQVAFETEDSKTFDEIIGQGYPYPDMPLAPELITTGGIVAHAKKIAACIIPNEYIYAIEPRRSFKPGSGPTYSWDVDLYLGPEDTKKYLIRLDYIDFPVKHKGMYVYLRKIEIFKEGHFFDPPSLSNVRKFKRVEKGRWKSNIDHHFPIVQDY